MKDRVLWGILVFALCLRLAGFFYGLPLTLVGDEPPFVLSALKMIELHTVVPALHPEEFASILYYPPYISYLYLLPFVATIGFTLLSWHGTSALFPSYLLSDLSAFFEIGRAFTIMFSLASIYLLYKIAESVYNSKAAARISAFLLSTSVLHMSLSMVGRHWMPVSFLFLLVLFILTRERITPMRKVFFSLLIIGIGSGVSTVAFLILIPLSLWFFFLSGVSLIKALKDKWAWGGVGAFILLSAIPILLSANSQGALAGGFSLLQHKTIQDLFLSPFVVLSLNMYSEPILVVLFLAGIIALWFFNRRFAVFAASFFILYAAAFYLLFEFQPRFTLPLIPLYALVAPSLYLAFKRSRVATAILIVLLVVPLSSALRIADLAYKNDTRLNAREATLALATPDDKVLVYGKLLRIPTTALGVAALRAIDPAAVRRTDTADEALNNTSLPLVLNLSNVQNKSFFEQLPDYAVRNGYSYAIIQEGYGEEEARNAFKVIESGATEIARLEGFGETTSITESAFTDPFLNLFAQKQFGPTMVIYRIR